MNELSLQQLPISRALCVGRGGATPGPGQYSQGCPWLSTRTPTWQRGANLYITDIWGFFFFNITTALIILHTNPIPGTNLLSQSSYFSPVHILTSIKFSVCPKLTNTAHCFIQWRQSINKAQLLSLSAFLHFRITVSYVDAGASDADVPTLSCGSVVRLPVLQQQQEWGRNEIFPSFPGTNKATTSKKREKKKKWYALKLSPAGRRCKCEWHLSPWLWLSTHLLFLFSLQNECTIKTQSISVTFPKCAVSVPASLLALARAQISQKNKLSTFPSEKLKIKGCRVGTNQASNLLSTN